MTVEGGGPGSLTIDGRRAVAGPESSLVRARLDAGLGPEIGVGCFGQGSCGSCRAMVRRAGSDDVEMVLGCETIAEPGMTVAFLAPYVRHVGHRYDLDDVADGWSLLSTMAAAFPEAEHCRHCGGCDAACPRQLPVEQAVADAVAGRVGEAARAFDECVMCDLCTLACPEDIAPNHLGVFARRATARLSLRPPELLVRLHDLEQGRGEVDVSGLDTSGAPR